MRYLITTCLILLALITSVTAQIMRPKRAEYLPEVIYPRAWALLIGIDQYPNLPPQYQLKHPVKGAESLGRLLFEHYGFEGDDITFLDNERATKEGILNALESLTEMDRVGDDDCVLVFFSGIGRTVSYAEDNSEENMGFLVPYDIPLEVFHGKDVEEFRQYCIGMDDLELMGRLTPAKHKLFIIDACYDGISLGKSKKRSLRILGNVSKILNRRGIRIINAGDGRDESLAYWDYYSIETDYAYREEGEKLLFSGYPRGGLEFFTDKLLEGLEYRRADINNDGIITATEFFIYITLTMRNGSRGRWIPQFRRVGAGEFMFIPQPIPEMAAIGDDEIPEFPWPPPKASTSYNVPSEFFDPTGSGIHLKHVAEKLEMAFEETGYVERSFYSVPDGFALVSRLEQFNEDGTPKEHENRWAAKVDRPKISDFVSYIKALLKPNKGYYRVIVFIVTSRLFTESEAETDFDTATGWLRSGMKVLPPEIGERIYTENHYCTALVYEFEKPTPDHEANYNVPSRIPGKEHLEKSGLLKALKGE
jgi:hypothetical protein